MHKKFKQMYKKYFGFWENAPQQVVDGVCSAPTLEILTNEEFKSKFSEKK